MQPVLIYVVLFKTQFCLRYLTGQMLHHSLKNYSKKGIEVTDQEKDFMIGQKDMNSLIKNVMSS